MNSYLKTIKWRNCHQLHYYTSSGY